MRFFITMGGSIGFLLALASSLHAGNALTFALRDAGIGCVLSALLFRGAHYAFFTSLQTHVRERGAAIQAAATEAAAATNPPS